MLSKYSDILGKPNEGIHSTRMFGIAINDLVMTMIMSFVIAKILKKKTVHVFIALMVLAIFVHKIFGVKTALNTKLFGS